MRRETQTPPVALKALHWLGTDDVDFVIYIIDKQCCRPPINGVHYEVIYLA